MPANTLTRTVASNAARNFSRSGISNPKSILKRPPPLPLSANPFPFAASFSIVVSPSAPKSPHVHFPASPSLTATFTAHSPNTYDRAAIIVSPNPLELPAWGDRVFSPSTQTFKSSKLVSSPTISGPTVVAAPAQGEISLPSPLAKKQQPESRARARFEAKMAGKQQQQQMKRRDVGKALTQYPRSPYPSAPMSPSFQMAMENMMEEDSQTRTQRSNSFGESRSVRFANAPMPAPLNLEGGVNTTTTTEAPVSAASENQSDDSLTQAFWQSVQLDSSVQSAAAEAEESASVPTFTFGTKDGMLWSPGLPRKVPRESILSPGIPESATRSMFMSPKPDATASFPSFSAVLSFCGPDEVIAYPRPAVLSGSRM